LDRPASLDVARLLGAFNLLPAEIRALDPGRNVSRVQFGEFDLEGPYFPGKLKGDRVTLCVRPEQIAALARNGRPGPNQIPATLDRAIEKSQSVRLEFAGGIAVDLPRGDYERLRETREWLIEFPSGALRAL
jgi:molybdate transport system ATP-binding protein